MAAGSNRRVVAAQNTSEYFHAVIRTALERQQMQVTDETRFYLGNLLNGFVRSEQLFDNSGDRARLQALAEIYAEALFAPSDSARDQNLRRLGDVALFIAGLFSHSLSRSLVDVDYYIAMGGNAYSTLAASGRRGTGILQQVYAELARRFAELVDVIAEAGDHGQLSDCRDVLRLYEIWLCSGSRRAAEELRRLGIQPLAALPRSQH